MRFQLDPFSPTGVSVLQDSSTRTIVKNVQSHGYIGSDSSTSGGGSGGTVSDATTSSKGIVQLAGDLGGTAALPKIKRTSRFIVAPYGDTRPADYTCASATGNEVEINTAIVAANALTNGGVVDLLDGTFVLSDSVVPLSNVWFRGQGMYKTKITCVTDGAFSLVSFHDTYSSPSNPLTNAVVSDMELDGSNMLIAPASGNKGVDGYGMYGCRFTRLYVHDTTASGLGIDGPVNTSIDHNIIINCGYKNKKVITAASWASSVITFTTATAHGYTGSVKATGTLTGTGIPIDGDTVSIGNATYTFKTTLTGTSYEVLINGSLSNALINLNKATNLTGIAGTDYGTGTLINQLARGSAVTSTTMTVSAVTYGTGGNSVASTSVSAAVSFGASTLSGGTTGNRILVNLMLPNGYNGIYSVSNVLSSTQFTIDAALNNSGLLNLGFNPGTVTQFGYTSDFSISDNGIGIGTGGMYNESVIVSDNVVIGSQNNNYLLETNQPNTGVNASYVFSNNISQFAGQDGYRTTGARNAQFLNCTDYGSLRGGHISSFTHAATLTVASWSGGVATFTTSAAYLFVTGQKLAVSGMVNANYNGYYTVASTPTSTTFTVAIVSDPGIATFDPNSTTPKATYLTTSSTTEGTMFSNFISSNNGLYGILVDQYCDNYTLDNVEVMNSSHYGIYVQSGLGTISGKSYKNGRTGLLVVCGSSYWPIDDLNLTALHCFNNGQLTGGYGIQIDSSTTTPVTNMIISGSHLYDNQATPTQLYGLYIPSGGNNQNIQVNNVIARGNVTKDIYVQDTSNTIYVNNNIGKNPKGQVALGNITGSTTFNTALGDFFIATLTGNVTAIFPLSTTTIVPGTSMTLVLTQDATGSRTLTLPSNAAAAQGGLTLSTAANAVDVVQFTWDGNKWRETSRDLATVATSGFTNPMTTLGDLLYENSTPAATRLAGNTTTTKKFLTQTGNGTISAAPGWGTIANTDVSGLGTASTMAGPTGTIVGTTDTQTLTNKRLTDRINTTASSATPAINVDTTDQFNITALAVAITSMTSGLTGTPTDGQKLRIRIKDNGTARAITWGALFVNSGTANLLTTTVISKTHLVALIYDSAAAVWVCVACDTAGY